MALWYKIIRSGGQPDAIDANIEYNQLKSNLSDYYNAATGFLEPLTGAYL